MFINDTLSTATESGNLGTPLAAKNLTNKKLKTQVSAMCDSMQMTCLHLQFFERVSIIIGSALIGGDTFAIFEAADCTNKAVREAPLRKTQGLFGHCPNGRGVLTLARIVWGTYFEKNCPCSKGHLLGLGGLNPCQDGLGHLCSEN